eukprot:jgi/Ulvmu1/8935/UM005_0026.1
MKQYTVPALVFKDPKSALRLQVWLENCSVQQRHVCLKLLSSLGGHGSYGGIGKGTVVVTSRPSTATGCRGASSLAAEGQKCSLAPRRPQSASFRPETAPERQNGASIGTDADKADAAPVHTSAWMTTNDQYYGFRRLYPAVYKTAAEASKAVPAANMLFTSEYADSLKKGAGPYWRRFLQTTNQVINNSARPPKLDDQVKQDQCFFSWMQRQRLYYGDLLSDSAAARLDQMMGQADQAGKLELLESVRLLYAALQPDRHKSTTHSTHSALKSMSEPYYEALQKDLTKAMAMGMPVEPAIASSSQCPHKANWAPSSLDRQAKDLAQPGRAKPVLIDKDTFASKIPMKWPVAGGHSTTYTDTIGKSSQKAAEAASKRRKPFVPVVITSPYGNTHPFMDTECTSRLKRFVVPEAFLQRKPALFTNADRNPPSTCNRMGFPRPSAADMAKNQQQAAKQTEQAAAMKV